MALSTTSNWLCNFIIAFITPPLFSSIAGGYYFLLLGFCVVSGIFVFFVYPETAHRTLEELGEVFGDKVTDDQVPDSVAIVIAVPEKADEAHSGDTGESTLRGSVDVSEVQDKTTDNKPVTVPNLS